MKNGLKILVFIFCLANLPFASDKHVNQMEGDSYLKIIDLPDALKILPPPPTQDSADYIRDTQIYLKTLQLKGTARWEQAKIDAELHDLFVPFYNAFGLEITEKNTPITYKTLKKAAMDASMYGTQTAKVYYSRIRPFAFYSQASCTPDDEAKLRKNGSYPSGHSALGWTLGLLLTELRPDRQDELLARGYEYGQSRVVCGAHWQSDVDAGRVLASAVIARLHADPQFLKDMESSKEEINKILKR